MQGSLTSPAPLLPALWHYLPATVFLLQANTGAPPSLIMGHHATEAAQRLDKASLAVKLGKTNQLSQTAAIPRPSNRRSGNQVHRGIKGDYLGHPGFFYYREMWRIAAQHVWCGCPLWLTVVLHSVMGKGEAGRAGPKKTSLNIDA